MNNKITMAQPYFPSNEVTWLTEKISEILDGHELLSMGKRVAEFETMFASYLGIEYAVATSSCTAALEISIRNIEIESNDEIIVPVETFIATGSSILREGARPVFCDIDSETYCISLESVKRSLTENTRAVIVVHMGGLISPDIWKIKEFCQANNLTLIEDAAHALGSSIDGVKAGTIGDVGCFSFYPTKTITTGEGGMLVTKNQNIFNKSSSLRDRGRDMHASIEQYNNLGSNNRMTEISALMGISQLKHIDKFLNARNTTASIYNEIISNSLKKELVRPILVPSNQYNSYWRYLVVLSEKINRVAIRDRMLSQAIPVDWAYHPPLHLQPLFVKRYGTKAGDLPLSEGLLNNNLCLPMHTRINEHDAVFIAESFVDAINEQIS